MQTRIPIEKPATTISRPIRKIQECGMVKTDLPATVQIYHHTRNLALCEYLSILTVRRPYSVAKYSYNNQ